MKNVLKRELLKEVKIKLLDENMSQNDLAKVLGVTPQYLSAVLNGKYDATIMTLKLKEWLYETDK